VSDTAAAEEIGTVVAQLRAWLTEVDPALLYEAPSPGEWTVMELLAHTVEFLRYWPPVMVGIAAEPGRSFGRGLDDSDRTGYVLAHGGDPLRSMVQELSAAGEEAQATLAAIPAVGWEATGVHMDWGELALPQIVQRVLTGHLAAHYAQAKAAYDTVSHRDAL
jgi:DinB superfamily